VLAGGGELHLRAAALAPLPPELGKLHVIGLVSPQLLAEEGDAVLVDPAGPSLAIGPADALVAESRARPLGTSDAKVCADVTGDGHGGHVPVRLYGLRAQAGAKEGWMLLDSGAPSSRLRAGSPLAEGLSPASPTSPLALRFAGTSRSVDVRVGRSPAGCADDGVLGADALTRCALVLGADRLWMRCD
jgi:hypothetical protein